MPSKNGIHESVEDLNNSYYQNDSASASSTTVPLVFRTSGIDNYSSAEFNDTSSLQSSGRNSELYNDLLEEVKRPNMPSYVANSEDSDTLPTSLRIASYQQPSPRRTPSKNSTGIGKKASKSHPKGHNDRPDLVSSKDAQNLPKFAPRDSLQHRGSDRRPPPTTSGVSGKMNSNYTDRAPGRANSDQSRKPVGTTSRSGQTLPTSAYQPGRSTERPSMGNQAYKPYRPSQPTRNPSNAKGKSSYDGSKKPLAAAAAGGVVMGAAAATYAASSANDAPPPDSGVTQDLYDGAGYSGAENDVDYDDGYERDQFASSQMVGFQPDSPSKNLDGTALNYGDSTADRDLPGDPNDTSFFSPDMEYQAPPSLDLPRQSFSTPERMQVPGTPQVIPPLDESISPAGFDNSTPGSPHDSPLDLQHSPMSAFMPQGDGPADFRNSFEDGDTGNNVEGTRSLEDPFKGDLDEVVSPSSSFGGPQSFPAEAGYPKDDFLDPFSPPDGSDAFRSPELNRELPMSPTGDPQSFNEGLDNEPRTMSLSDAGPDYTDEKGVYQEVDKKKPIWKQRKFLIIGGVIAAVLVIAIIIGIVFAVRSKGDSDDNDKDDNDDIKLDTDNDSSNNDNNENIPVLGGFKTQDPAVVNDAFVVPGTSMNTVTINSATRKRQSSNSNVASGTSFFNFYQHSTGEIRMAGYQNSNFQPSILVVNDGHYGTPIAAYSRPSNQRTSVFYFNKDKILQEVRSQDGIVWQPGTIGQLGLTSNAPSDLTVEYVSCGRTALAWLVFHTGVNDQTKLIYWNEATDTWTEAGGFPGVKQGAGFQGQSDGDAWRFYYVSSLNSQLSQMVCPDCCDKPQSPSWTPGINGPPVSSATGGITVVNAGTPRLIYYQDADGTVRELNNTGKYPQENYMTNVAPSRRGNIGVPAPNDTPTGPIGLPIGKVLPESKMGVAAGFRGSIPQLWLFTQVDATSISLVIRNVDVVGQWTAPISIPVGR